MFCHLSNVNQPTNISLFSYFLTLFNPLNVAPVTDLSSAISHVSSLNKVLAIILLLHARDCQIPPTISDSVLIVI